jgi:hypothetical protein
MIPTAPRLRNSARAAFFCVKLIQNWRPSHRVRIELEFSANHHDDPRMISGFEAHVSQCFCASYKEAAAETALISNDPVPAAVSANHED